VAARAIRITASERAELRRDWESYRDGALEALGNHCRGGNVLTDEARARGKRAEDIFSGPWHHWDTLITDDAREWFDDNGRITWSQYLDDITARDDTSADETVYILERLAELRELEAREAELLTRGRKLGIAWGALCEARGRSRSAVNAVVRSANGGRVPC
jgi:hypothetical protein